MINLFSANVQNLLPTLSFDVNTMSEVGSLSSAALARKQKLAALRSKRNNAKDGNQEGDDSQEALPK